MYLLRVILFVVVVLSAFSYIALQIPQEVSMPPKPEKFDPQKVQTKSDVVEIGQKIFFGKGQCALCHTIGTDGGRCPNLERVGMRLNREFIYETVTQPQAYVKLDFDQVEPKKFPAQMPVINKPPIGLNEQELLAVISFVQSLGGKVTIEPSEFLAPGASPAQAGAGQEEPVQKQGA